ncbi:MAG: carbamoyltransferase C-terminal domain-containing protein [Candidatus Lernaella stagnicola]|nr:carbamoyltransferase C-terminal domain-containing protein [Candidatus Lernaella stagnicola]
MTDFVYRDDRAGRRWIVPHLPIDVTRPDDVPGAVAALLAEGRVVGWFQGGSEFGPRALGHRSILADPRDANVHAYLNEHVKHRQWFRPYAPAVLAEHLEEWFDLHVPSPHMLLVADVLADKRERVPAIVHIDGTARVQTVDADGGLFRAVIERFHELTGMPMVLNTSFNDHGEPIVETPLDAYQCFTTTALDALAIGPLLITKEQGRG